MLEVSRGLEYLHHNDVVHGDLRAVCTTHHLHRILFINLLLSQANILVTSAGTAVIADFGLAFVIDQTEFTTSKIAGSARWSPPEVLNPQTDNDDSNDEESDVRRGVDGDELCMTPYSKKSDMYSVAMVFYEVRVCLFTSPLDHSLHLAAVYR